MSETTENVPRIVPRSEHTISRKNLTPEVLVVLRELDRHGYRGYLVGGAIRDLLLGLQPKDMDVATDATPNQVKRLFRSCRLIGRRFRLAHVHFRECIVEVATFRRSDGDPDEIGAETPETPVRAEETRELPARRHEGMIKAEDGVILRDNLFGTPEQDARRRDFTINALFYDISDFSLIDYVGGLDDIRDRIVRTIGDPVVRFTEDPVRMVRAVRFAAMLGFSLEPGLRQAITDLASHLAAASPSRMFEEVIKLFGKGYAKDTLRLLVETGLFDPLFPNFTDLGEKEHRLALAELESNLAWLDSQVRNGEALDPALLFGLLLLPTVERSRRCTPALEGADLFRMGEDILEEAQRYASCVLVPVRCRQQIRSMIACQGRFQRMRGKFPRRFASSLDFPLALRFLHFGVDRGVVDARLLEWWECFLLSGEEGQPAPFEPAAAAEGPPEHQPRKRRRRRRGKRREHSDMGLPPPSSVPEDLSEDLTDDVEGGLFTALHGEI